MAFNLFKWFTTGNGDEDTPKPKAKAPSDQPRTWDKYLATGRKAPSADKTNIPQSVLRDPNASKTAVGTGPYGSQGWGQLKEIPRYNYTKTAEPTKNPSFKQYPDNVEQQNIDDRQNYDMALGANDLGNIKELTWDEYDALSPRARAAVDANSALLNAVRQDKQANLLSKESGDDSYNEGVKALFGEHGGSDTYAPATLKVLQDLGLSNTETGDIDQYLSGGALLRADDLPNLNDQNFAGYEGKDVRVQNALALSEKALGNMASKLQSGENPLSGLTYDDPAASELDQLFDSLALRDNQQIFQQDPAKAGEVIGLFLQANPSIDQNTFARYFEDRINRYDYSRAAGDQAASLGNGAPELYIDPSELRSLIYQKEGQ